MTNNNPITVSYPDGRLRVLVEEYITQQRAALTLRGVCSYILYWAMEEGQALAPQDGLFEGDQLSPADSQRVSRVLEAIADEGRIVADGEEYRKVME